MQIFQAMLRPSRTTDLTLERTHLKDAKPTLVGRRIRTSRRSSSHFIGSEFVWNPDRKRRTQSLRSSNGNDGQPSCMKPKMYLRHSIEVGQLCDTVELGADH